MKGRIDVALGDHLGPGFLQTGLHAGQPAKPDQVQVSGSEGANSGGVVDYRHVLDRHPQLFAQLLGHLAIKPVELFGVLVGNGADPQHRAARLGGGGAQAWG